MSRAIFDLEPNAASGGAVHTVICNNELGPSGLYFLAPGGAGSNVSFTLAQCVARVRDRDELSVDGRCAAAA